MHIRNVLINGLHELTKDAVVKKYVTERMLRNPVGLHESHSIIKYGSINSRDQHEDTASNFYAP